MRFFGTLMMLVGIAVVTAGFWIDPGVGAAEMRATGVPSSATDALGGTRVTNLSLLGLKLQLSVVGGGRCFPGWRGAVQRGSRS